MGNRLCQARGSSRAREMSVQHPYEVLEVSRGWGSADVHATEYGWVGPRCGNLLATRREHLTADDCVKLGLSQLDQDLQ